MNTLEKIKAFSKISISKICDDLKVNRSNLLNGKAPKHEEEVLEEIKERVKKILDL